MAALQIQEVQRSCKSVLIGAGEVSAGTLCFGYCMVKKMHGIWKNPEDKNKTENTNNKGMKELYLLYLEKRKNEESA